MGKKLICVVAMWFAPFLRGQTLKLSGPFFLTPNTPTSYNVVLEAPLSQIAALQWDLKTTTNLIGKVVVGEAATKAEKTLYCNPDNSRCLIVGINTNLVQSGVIATYTFNSPVELGKFTLGLTNVVAATLEGDATSLVPGNDILVNNPYDLNKDGSVDIKDLQSLIQEVLSMQTTKQSTDTQKLVYFGILGK